MKIEEQCDEYLSWLELLEADLYKHYGPLLGGELLVDALGYNSKDAFRQSLSRGTVPIPIFEIENRRGKFALTKDIAKFLAEKRMSAKQKRRK